MSLGRVIPFLIIFLLVLSQLSCREHVGTVGVIQVIDGDTIIVDGGYHVRYIGIDSPERDDPYYLESRQMNKELVGGKQVKLRRDISDKDKFGRLLRYVYIGDTFINAEMVRQGYAYTKIYLPDTKYQAYLEAMEKEARQAKRGIWE